MSLHGLSSVKGNGRVNVTASCDSLTSFSLARYSLPLVSPTSYTLPNLVSHFAQFVRYIPSLSIAYKHFPQLQLMNQVLQDVRGMRQSLSNIHRTRAQASFAEVVAPSLRRVSEEVTTSLHIISTNVSKLIALPIPRCQASRSYRAMERIGSARTITPPPPPRIIKGLDPPVFVGV